jgi:CRP/FNR family transcriptional regulator
MGYELSVLKKIPIFSNLVEKELREIEPYLIKERYKKKDEIFREGDPSDWFYILINGKIKITKLSLEGKEIIVELISPFDFFGGLAALKGFPYPANAIAMEDSEILKISKTDILKLIDRFPSIMYEITSNLSIRVKEFHETLKSVALEKVESRIASLLVKLANKIGKKVDNKIVIDMKLTKQDIAEMVGTTVETSIRTISKFKKLGLLKEENGKILINDLDKLQSIYL